ncbi:MAG: addiction module protein [Desulfatirhabdiaceae bacterium]
MQAMELLWDALSHNDHEMPSPAWHEEILKKRKDRIRRSKIHYT